MAKKERKLDEQVFFFAVKVTSLTALTFLIALGIDVHRAARFVMDLYAARV